VTPRAFGGLAVVVVVLAAVVGVAIGAATAPDGSDRGGAPVTTAPLSTPPPSATATQVSTLTIELSAPESATANNRFELTGLVSGGSGGEQLQVQRRLDGGDWEGFPEDEPIVSEPNEDGTFAIGIQTARVGANGFRIATPSLDGQLIFSNEVAVQVG
jgi:hypothetical protein